MNAARLVPVAGSGDDRGANAAWISRSGAPASAWQIFLFVTLGWFEVHGVWAMLVIAVLVVEVLVTLMDFVEEDISRKLPASERINHTLLALNYGLLRLNPG